MPKQPPNEGRPAQRQRSTENFGQGQSGYTAGRVEDDESLQIDKRNSSYPDRQEEPHEEELGTDGRFTGEGATPWAPDAEDSQKGS